MNNNWEGTYVTATAQVRCSCGSGKRKLIVEDHNKYIRGHAQANIRDNKIERVFDGCSKRGERGCVPEFSDWVFGKRDVLLDGSPVLLRSSKLYCKAGGGTISIVDDGQNPAPQLSGIGAVGAKELLKPKPEEPKPEPETKVDWKFDCDPLKEMRVREDKASSLFGVDIRWEKRNGELTKTRDHQGIDLYATIGTDILAVGNGKVIWIRDKGDYGLQLLISFKKNNKEFYAFYAHLSKICVKQGDSLKTGQIIGKTGDSGNAKGMKGDQLHLHFELRTVKEFVGGMAGRLDPFPRFIKKMIIK